MRYLRKVLNFLKGNSMIGGLEISDFSLRFAYLKNNREWQMTSIRLAPGIMKANVILDYHKFVESLFILKKEIFKKDQPQKKILVVVSLGSLNIYTQIFSLPKLEGHALKEAVKLNLQMVAPSQVGEHYSGWQLVGTDETAKKVDILSVFVGRTMVDELSKALLEAGFLVIAVESRSFSLTRIFREQSLGIDSFRPYILLSLDNESLDFIIIKRGQMYFEYFNSWQDLKGGGKEISISEFRTVVVRNLRQVLNFYGQHWSEPVEDVILATPGLGEEITKIIKDNFSLRVKNLELKLDRPVSSEWFGALGGGIRSIASRRDDREINLSGVEAEDNYRRGQILNFLRFWLAAAPIAMGVLLLVFALTIGFLTKTNNDLIRESKISDGDSQKFNEVKFLKQQAEDFNKSLDIIAPIRDVKLSKAAVFEKINSILVTNNSVLTKFSFSSFDTPVTLVGESKTREDAAKLEKVFNSDPFFGSVDFQFTKITLDPDGDYSFPITFSVISPKM
ncbi:MAG: hypothetical protein WCX12_03110 [Candidatus Paceibacterota bacterium]|jgi:hypothetical protein